jgi:predicted SAM-dependent methyltransferase
VVTKHFNFLIIFLIYSWNNVPKSHAQLKFPHGRHQSISHNPIEKPFHTNAYKPSRTNPHQNMPMKKLLHVGCGNARIEHTTQGFNNGQWQEIRLDIDPAVKPDIQGTMTDMSQVPDNSVDAIFSSHNIEHLYPHEVPIALAEFQRVLAADGFCVITCPDLKSVCALVAQDQLTEPAYNSPAGPIAPIDMLYGHRGYMGAGNLFMAHRCGFTEKVLRGTLNGCGFPWVATLARPNAFDLWAIACKSHKNDDELKALAREHIRV